MTWLFHCYRLLIATLRLTAAFAQVAWHCRHQVMRDLSLQDLSVLTAKEIRRIRHYTYGTTYLVVLFCVRTSRRRTARERYLFSNLAALACFFDDLVDAFQGQNDTDWVLPETPEAYGHAADDPRGLSLHFLKNVCENLPPECLPEFRNLMQRVFRVEAAGQQRDTANFLKISDLEKITTEKGGYSVLLFRCLLLEPISENEQSFWREFGMLIQLCDDIFDLWHDRQAGTATLATFFAEQNDVRGLVEIFERQARAVSQESGRIQGEIHFLLAITRVCLRHYAELLETHGSLPLDDRRLMVVDMERWQNRWRAALELLRR